MKPPCSTDGSHCDLTVKHKTLGYIRLLSEEVICNIETYHLLSMHSLEVKEEERILTMSIYQRVALAWLSMESCSHTQIVKYAYHFTNMT